MTAPLPLPRSALALVVDRTFGPYFVGNLASNIGTWCQQITAAVVIYDLTGSTFMVGMVGVSQFLPSLVAAPWTGAAADRFDRRKLLLGAQTVAAVAVAILSLIAMTLGLERFAAGWPVLVTAFVVGLVNALSTPAQQALVPALVPPSDLDQALALNSVTYNLARAVGPAIGAAILIDWGAGAAFGVNAFSYLVLVVGLLLIRSEPIERPARASVWVGFRHLRTDPIVAYLLIGITALGFGVDPVLTLTPALAERLQDATFSNPDALVGLLISAFGAGAVIGTLIVGRIRRRWGHIQIAATGLGLLVIGVAGLAFSARAWFALGCLVLSGVGFLFGVTCLTSAMHTRIPEELRGRIMALWGVAFLGSRPVAAFIDGAIADVVSPRAATLVAAGVVAACFVVLVTRVLPSYRSPAGGTTPGAQPR